VRPGFLFWQCRKPARPEDGTESPFCHFQEDHLRQDLAMPITPDDHPAPNGSAASRDDEARARNREEESHDFDDRVEEGEGEQMSGWCGELGDYVAAHPLKAVVISFMTGWVASRVLW
jgi:hypothetical protein